VKSRVDLSQAEALSQLIKDIKKYPASTVFHFNAWTFGYEDLWVAIASALNCQVTLLSRHR